MGGHFYLWSRDLLVEILFLSERTIDHHCLGKGWEDCLVLKSSSYWWGMCDQKGQRTCWQQAKFEIQFSLQVSPSFFPGCTVSWGCYASLQEYLPKVKIWENSKFWPFCKVRLKRGGPPPLSCFFKFNAASISHSCCSPSVLLTLCVPVHRLSPDSALCPSSLLRTCIWWTHLRGGVEGARISPELIRGWWGGAAIFSQSASVSAERAAQVRVW